MFVTSKVLSTNPSATILSRTLIVNFKGMIVLLYCNIQSIPFMKAYTSILSLKAKLSAGRDNCVDSPLAT
jgi:hypothetical protein